MQGDGMAAGVAEARAHGDAAVGGRAQPVLRGVGDVARRHRAAFERDETADDRPPPGAARGFARPRLRRASLGPKRVVQPSEAAASMNAPPRERASQSRRHVFADR